MKLFAGVLFLIFSFAQLCNAQSSEQFKKCNTITYQDGDNELQKIDDLLFEENLKIENLDKDRGVIETSFTNNFDDNGSLVYTSFLFRIRDSKVYISGEYYSSAS